jgi:hypothetical protein
MRKSPALTLAPLAFLLAACGGAEAPTSSPSPTPEETQAVAPVAPKEGTDQDTGDASAIHKGDGLFFVSPDGGIGRITVPSEANRDIEALRKIAGEKPVTYAHFEIDNRESATPIRAHQLDIFDASGAKYEFLEASEVIGEWRDVVDLDEDGSTEIYNQFIEVSNSHLDSIDSGAVGEMWMILEDDLPDEFAQVTVGTDSMGNSIYAVSDKDSQGIDFTFEVPERNKR